MKSKNSKKVHICYLTLNQIQIQSKNLKEFTELHMTESNSSLEEKKTNKKKKWERERK